MFVTFEGGEGAGKSTIMRIIAEQVNEHGLFPEVVITREPGGSSIGPAIRELVLSRDFEHLNARAEALLFAAERVQHVEEVIRPALERGALVLCDRYIDSSVAYQGHARGLDRDKIREISDWGTEHLTPQLTLVVDIHPDTGIARKHAQRETNKMEDLSMDFHHVVRQAFLDIAMENESRVIIIDGHQQLDYAVADAMTAIISRKAHLDAPTHPDDLY